MWLVHVLLIDGYRSVGMIMLLLLTKGQGHSLGILSLFYFLFIVFFSYLWKSSVEDNSTIEELQNRRH